MRRKLTWMAIAAAMMLGGAAHNSLSATDEQAKKWENLFGFPDCYYTCGSNSGHPSCSCAN